MDSGAMWMRMKASLWAYTLSILVALSVGILIGTVISEGVKGKEGQKSDATPLALPSPQQMSNTFSQIAKQLEPSVVNINTESTIKNVHRRRGQNPDDDDSDGGGGMDDFFNHFFGGPGGGGGQAGPGGPGGSGEGAIRERSLGSGGIVRPQGSILTNRPGRAT